MHQSGFCHCRLWAKIQLKKGTAQPSKIDFYYVNVFICMSVCQPVYLSVCLSVISTLIVEVLGARCTGKVLV